MVLLIRFSVLITNWSTNTTVDEWKIRRVRYRPLKRGIGRREPKRWQDTRTLLFLQWNNLDIFFPLGGIRTRNIQTDRLIVDTTCVRFGQSFFLLLSPSVHSIPGMVICLIARLGFFPTTLCRGPDMNPRHISRVAPTRERSEQLISHYWRFLIYWTLFVSWRPLPATAATYKISFRQVLPYKAFSKAINLRKWLKDYLATFWPKSMSSIPRKIGQSLLWQVSFCL